MFHTLATLAVLVLHLLGTSASIAKKDTSIQLEVDATGTATSAAKKDTSIQLDEVGSVTDCVHDWSHETVIQWARASYSENENFIAALTKSRINGKVLKLLDDLDFKDDLGITSSILRKRLLSEVQDLAAACKQKAPAYIHDDDNYTPNHAVNATDPVTAEILRRMKEEESRRHDKKKSQDKKNALAGN